MTISDLLLLAGIIHKPSGGEDYRRLLFSIDGRYLGRLDAGEAVSLLKDQFPRIYALTR